MRRDQCLGYGDCFGRGGAGASEKADLQQLGRNLRRQSNHSKKLKACRSSRKVPMPRPSMKPNGIAAPSRMKGDCRLFPFATLTSLVHTKILEVNTPRRFRLLLRKQSETSRLRFSETAGRRETSFM